jgi:hypothetical protein
MLHRIAPLRRRGVQALALVILLTLAGGAWHANPAASFTPFANSGALALPVSDGAADDTVDDNETEAGLLLLSVFSFFHLLLVALRRITLFSRPGADLGLLHPPQIQPAS